MSAPTSEDARYGVVNLLGSIVWGAVASGFAAPDDERWARTLDDLRQFADDLWDKTEGEAS